MSKHFLEDMVRDKRKRQGIEVPRTEKASEIKVPKEKKQVIREPEEIEEIKTPERGQGSRYGLWFVACISIVFCFFAVSFLFSRAKVVVEPKIQKVVLKENLSASHDSESSLDSLSFDLVIISGEESKTIESSGQKDVTDVATGTVVLYNNFSTASQVLAIDTRLEGSNGKIYKTKTRTVVPGKSSSGTPGTIEVKIYAAAPGAEYNSAPLDFKILGFKGTPKYAGFYGRSKGSITGGFIGKVAAVSDEDKNAALLGLGNALREKLLQQATSQVPSGFLLFKGAVFLNSNDGDVSSVDNTGKNSMTLTQKGTLYGIILNEQELTQKIAKANIPAYDDSEVYVSNIQDLKFTLLNEDQTSFENMKNVSFTLTGTAQIVYKLDTDTFVADLLGTPKKDFNQTLSQYPNIDSATLTLSPLWKMSIPKEAKNVKVLVDYP